MEFSRKGYLERLNGIVHVGVIPFLLDQSILDGMFRA